MLNCLAGVHHFLYICDKTIFRYCTSMQNLHLGEFEELVLLAVCGLGEAAYAVPIQQRIEARAGRTATMGAVYAALDRLEQKGFLLSHLGAVTRQRGGKRKRFYEITVAGLAAVSAMRRARERMWEGLEWQPSLGLE